jgi:hypothetical protein
VHPSDPYNSFGHKAHSIQLLEKQSMATLVLIADEQAALIAGGKSITKTTKHIDFKFMVSQEAKYSNVKFAGDITQILDLSLTFKA